MPKRKKPFCLAALALCLVFLFSSCGFRELIDPYLPFELPGGMKEEGDAQETEPRRTIAFSEMEYSRPDAQGMVTQLQEFTENIEQANTFDELWALDEQATTLVEHYMTMSTLAEIHRYLDTGNPYYQEELRYCKENTVRISNAVNSLNTAIVSSRFAEEYEKRVGSYVYASIQNELLLNSPEVEGLKEEISRLQTDYNEDLSTLTIEHEGTSYTMADLQELEDSHLAYTLETQFNEQHADHFSEMYIQFIDLQNQTAQKLGFSSAAEMSYLSYSRDYTPSQALAFCQQVKEAFGNMTESILRAYTGTVSASEEEVLKMMPGALRRISPQMVEAFEFMQQYELYDFGARTEKQSGIGFTADLYSYDTAYIYGFWTNDLRSVTTLFHEFGHFFESWLSWDSDMVFNLDLSETYSQTLELLMQRFFPAFGQDTEAMVLSHLSDFSQSITYQCLLEEMQLQLYEMENLDTETISRLYTDLLVAYGFGSFTYSAADKDWVQITHLFDAPFYTISYATSACIALQIWEKSTQNWREGAALYMQMIETDQNQPFLEIVKSVGLRSPFSPSALLEIAGLYRQMFHLPSAEAA
ncbi:M3 family metallopeptidase [Ruminococcaceae bacterium OttesenSCG-928-I18]|nr:M3 family metallopeptidase [Ruminococcaceae bacterium OttesenSCG-928-I18]